MSPIICGDQNNNGADIATIQRPVLCSLNMTFHYRCHDEGFAMLGHNLGGDWLLLNKHCSKSEPGGILGKSENSQEILQKEGCSINGILGKRQFYRSAIAQIQLEAEIKLYHKLSELVF